MAFRMRWLRSLLFTALRQSVERHLKADLNKTHTVVHLVIATEQVSIQRVLDRWMTLSRPSGKVLGYLLEGYLADGENLAKYLITEDLVAGPVERTQLESGPSETLDCVNQGLFLLIRRDSPIAVAIRPGRYSNESPKLELIATTREIASEALSALLEEAKRTSVYRGRSIVIEAGKSYLDRSVNVRFQVIQPTPREDIVLPASVLEVVERNVLGMLKHAETLRAAGRSLRRGLLLHGPPGTGKTMVVRYLANSCTSHTVITLGDVNQGMIQEACKIARMLAPTIVVLEDVDIVAEDREHNRCPFVLHELLNEMDGIGPREEVTFLLTTNRPEVLEPALSARPGRVDQAIEFPLPDADCRRRLFEVYGRGLDLSAVDVERWVEQTNGVSPAFIGELLRKATLLAAERGETSKPIRLLDLDMQHAVKELVFLGGELTQKLLAYGTGSFGYRPTAK